MKERIFGFLIILCVTAFLIALWISGKTYSKPSEVYQVYLNGKKIGLIESQDSLLNLIDNEQANIKETFNVDKVYPPAGLNIEEVYTYVNKLIDTEDIYNQIKEKDPFTIKGYVVTIYYNNDEAKDEDVKEPLKIYVGNILSLNSLLALQLFLRTETDKNPSPSD